MQGNKKRELLEKNLQEELEWYTLYATDEEYDGKAVESILYLLDRWDPLEKGTVPPVEESWKRFLKVAGRKEFLPVKDGAKGQGPAEETEAAQRPEGKPESVLWEVKEMEAAQRTAGKPESVLWQAEEAEAGQKPVKEAESVLWQVEEAKAGQRPAGKPESGLRLVKEAEGEQSLAGKPESVLWQVKEMEAAQRTAGKPESVLWQAEEVEAGQKPVKEAESVLWQVEEAGCRLSPEGRAESEDGLGAEKDGRETLPGDGAGDVLQMQADGPENPGLSGKGKCCGIKKAGKLVSFVLRHKLASVAAFLLSVLVVGNTIHAVANPETGFFFWMKKDETGVEILTSPEALDGETNNNVSIYYEEEDVPEWAEEWVELETEIEFESQDEYELYYIEISELDNRKHIASHFLCGNSDKEIVVGIWVYWDKVSYFREGFMEYDYVHSYKFAQKEMDIYKKTDDSGEIYHTVCLYDGNCKYYVKGWENLDEIKKIVEGWWLNVKNNT